MAGPTPAQARALVACLRTERSGQITARPVADLLWPPDDGKRGRRTRRHDGRSGARRGTYPMLAAQLLNRCADRGWLAHSYDGRTHQHRWTLTATGRFLAHAYEREG